MIIFISSAQMQVYLVNQHRNREGFTASIQNKLLNAVFLESPSWPVILTDAGNDRPF